MKPEVRREVEKNAASLASLFKVPDPDKAFFEQEMVRTLLNARALGWMDGYEAGEEHAAHRILALADLVRFKKMHPKLREALHTVVKFLH